MCLKIINQSTSYPALHSINNRAIPDQMLKYKTTILLHNTHNDNEMSFECQQLLFNQNFNQRSNMSNFLGMSKYKFGKKLNFKQIQHSKQQSTIRLAQPQSPLVQAQMQNVVHH